MLHPVRDRVDVALEPCGAQSPATRVAAMRASTSWQRSIAEAEIARSPRADASAVENLLCKAVIGILAASCAAQGVRAAQPTTVMVAPGVYALLGSGGEITPENGGRTANVAFVVGPGGVVVVDTGISYREGEEIIAAVKSISNRPIRLAILTHPSQEAIFGAAAFQARGIPVLAHRRSAELIAARCETCLRNLRSALGEEAMAATRVVKPDRLIDGDETLELIGRPLRLIAPQWSSAPGAIAVFDEWTSTLIAGNLVTIQPNSRYARCEPESVA